MAKYTGNALANSYVGTAQDDDIDLRAGDDIAYGQGGDDFIYGGWGDDSLHGGDDDDLILGGQGRDFVFGDAGSDILHGDEDDDLLHGGSGIDVLFGGDGDDQLFGDGDDDVLIGGDGADALDGGSGIDQAIYEHAEGAVSVNLATGIGDGDDAEGDTYVSIEDVKGSAFADTIIGNAANNDLEGMAGADLIDGGGGFDFASYGSSLAAVNINLATGTASGGHAAGDVLINIENLFGSGHNDSLTGNSIANVIHGFHGHDTINGGGGNDQLRGDGGNDTIDGGTGGDTINGGEGNDTLRGGADADFISGETGDDALFGDGGIDHLQGGDGNDTLNGGEDADTLEGQLGNDTVDGDGGIDTVSMIHWNAFTDLATTTYSITLGEAGVDGAAVRTVFIFGNAIEAERDTLRDIENVTGSNKSETITGNSGANVINALAGNDTIIGGAGGDAINGGAGFDTASYANAASGIEVNLRTGAGTLGDAAGDTMTGIERVIGSAFNDVFFASANADTIEGGSGFDFVRFDAAAAAVTVDLANAATNTGDAAGDNYGAIEGIFGSSFGDTLSGDANVNELHGLDGDDLINGRGGSDVIHGGNGNDTVIGGTGNDILFGEAGDDRFVFTVGDGVDTIADFVAGDAGGDVIELNGYGITNFADLQRQMVQSGNDVVIAFDAANQITLQNVQLFDLNQSDFLLV